MCRKTKNVDTANGNVSKNEIINLIYYIRSLPRESFNAADVADMIIRRYFKELEEWK